MKELSIWHSLSSLDQPQNKFSNPLTVMNIIRYQRYPQSDFLTAFDRLTNMHEELDRVFESTSLGTLSRWTPAVDVYQDKDQFTVVAEVPGMKKEEIDISLHGDTLTISGERKAQEKQGEQGFRSERFFGKFQRSLTLPSAVNIEKVKASYKDGVLEVVLPKAEEAKPKQIEVSLT